MALKKQAKGNIGNEDKESQHLPFALQCFAKDHVSWGNAKIHLPELHADTSRQPQRTIGARGSLARNKKKVKDFLLGIMDPCLQIGKDVVLGTPLYLPDFEECQQYLSTLVSNTSTQAKNNCHIGAANHTDHDDDDEPPKKQFKKQVHTKLSLIQL